MVKIIDEFGERDATPAEIEAMQVGEIVIQNNIITARQIRLWLLTRGITGNTVIAAINQITDEIMKEGALINWEYSTAFERNNPLIDIVGSILGLESTEIDIAFNEALSL